MPPIFGNARIFEKTPHLNKISVVCSYRLSEVLESSRKVPNGKPLDFVDSKRAR